MPKKVKYSGRENDERCEFAVWCDHKKEMLAALEREGMEKGAEVLGVFLNR